MELLLGLDLATNVDLVDNQKIRFGTGNDLHIFHDGFNSYIDDNGTGELQFRTINGSNINLIGGSDFLAKFIKDGAVELYYDNSKKFEILSTGTRTSGDIQLPFVNNSTGLRNKLQWVTEAIFLMKLLILALIEQPFLVLPVIWFSLLGLLVL